MKSNKHQTGMSMLLMIVIIGLFGYAIFIGIKIIPVYMEFFSIRSAVDGIADQMQTRQISKNQFEDFMRKRLDINYVDYGSLVPRRDGCKKDSKDVLQYKRNKKDIEIGVSYEKRVPMIANIDFLLEFNHSKKISSNSSS